MHAIDFRFYTQHTSINRQSINTCLKFCILRSHTISFQMQKKRILKLLGRYKYHLCKPHRLVGWKHLIYRGSNYFVVVGMVVTALGSAG